MERRWCRYPLPGACPAAGGKNRGDPVPGGDGPGALAKSCDAAIYFVTIQEGEAHDRSLLTLPEVDTVRGASGYHGQIVDDASGVAIREDQEKAIQAIAATGVKTIVVLENGSPIDMHRWIGKVDAVLEAWYPGEQGGTAIVQTLFGDVDPGGRLPITWPKHAGQIPIYYAVKPSGRGYDYLDDDGKPMFPFGYGLSYTTFKYSDLIIPPTLHTGDSLSVKVTVTNTGDRLGDAVVELYLHDSVAPVVRPLRELSAFKRVTLAAGESREVILTVPYRSFGYWDRQLQYVVTKGYLQRIHQPGCSYRSIAGYDSRRITSYRTITVFVTGIVP